MRFLTRRVIAVLAVQLVVLTWLAAILPTWQDEEFTMATTAHGVAYAIHRALTYELQAPFYFAVVALLRRLNDSVFFAREFSVLAQVATTAIAAYIARRIWPQRNPWVFCALVASNPFTVFAALEIRVYSLALLEGAGLIACFFAGYLYGNDRRARYAFIACAIAGLYTQYFIAFDIAALFVALLVSGRLIALRVYVVSCIVALIAFVPLLLLVRDQASDGLSVEDTRPAGFGGMLLHPVNLVLAHDYLGTAYPHETIVLAILRVAFVVLVILGRPRFDMRSAALATIFLAVDLIYVVLSDVLKINFIIPRHFLALFFPEAILLYTIVATFTSRSAQRYAAGVAIVIAISSVATVVRTYSSGAKLGDVARIGSFLSAHAGSADAIAVYPGDGVAPIERYYRGPVHVSGYPVAQDPNVYHIDAALVRSGAEANAGFDRLPRTHRLWFAQLGSCGDANIHGCRTVDAVMASRYTIVQTYPFYEATLYELETKTP